MPETTPVLGLSVRLCGRPGATENTTSASKPLAVRGSVAVIGSPLTALTTCVAGVSDGPLTGAAATVMAMVAVALAVPSLAVTM